MENTNQEKKQITDIKQISVDFIVNTLLIITFLILSNYLVQYSFNILGYFVIPSVLTYPFVYFFANRITKEYGMLYTIVAVLLAVIVQFIAYHLFGLLHFSIETSSTIIKSMIAFILTQLICLVYYNELLRHKTVSFFKMILIYFVVCSIDDIIFTALTTNTLNFGLIYSMTFKLLVGIVLAYFISKPQK